VSTATLPLSAAPRHLDRAILHLALPATGATLLKSLFTFTDTVWCGRIDKNVLAAYGTASFYVWILNGISLVAAVGLAARVARATGAGDRTAAAAAARDGLATALPIALAATAVLWGLAPQLMALQGVGPEVAALGTAYLRTVSLGTVSFFALDAAAAALRGAGDTRTPALAALVATIVYQGLAPLLLFGWGPVPGLGIAGIGFCPVIVQSGVALFLWGRVVRQGGVTMTRPSLAGMKATARIGLPSATLSTGFSFVYVAIAPAIARFGTEQLAALAIGHRSESFAYQVGIGFAAASQALVGQGLGARRPDLARASARRAAVLAATATGAFSLLLLAFAPFVASIFSDDGTVVAAGSLYLRVIALSIAPQTIEQVLTGAFEGAGDTVPPLLVGVFAHGLRIPLVYLLTGPVGLGVVGVWATIAGCTITASAVLLVLFRRRRFV
jgi:putative MATE family efflux protein